MRISQCEQQAVKVMERASGRFHGCVLEDCREEGLVVMDSGEAALKDCCVRANRGPGLDVSGRGKVSAEGCEIESNVGGLWLWEEAKAALFRCKLEGGDSHVILADGDCMPVVSSCHVQGTVQATAEAWECISGDSNTFVEPSKPVELPPEDGPFKFEPVWYQRKQ